MTKAGLQGKGWGKFWVVELYKFVIWTELGSRMRKQQLKDAKHQK